MAVIVYAEHTEGRFKKSAFEVLSYAKEISVNTNTQLVVVTIGAVTEDNVKELGTYGADKILLVNHALFSTYNVQLYASAIAAASVKENANLVVFSNTLTGKGLAPAVAVKLKAAIAPAVTELPQIDGETLKIKTPVFSGKALATIEMSSANKVISVSPNSWPVKRTDGEALIENYQPALSDSGSKVQVLETVKTTEKIPLADAEIVVSGGRGLKGPENWGLIEDLADALDAAKACSKPVSDSGWRPHEEHVGQTGTVISPNLYIAAGISGAIQHVAGVSSSKVVVAINKDAEAPIFKIANYGIVGDIFEVLPKLTQSIKAFKGSVNHD